MSSRDTVRGPLAQLVERHVYTVDVVGSNPAGPTVQLHPQTDSLWAVSDNNCTVGTQREAWTKVFWGSVTSLVVVAGFVLIVGNVLGIELHEGRKTEVRTDWSGVWIHEGADGTSIFRLRADGRLAVSNLPREIVGGNAATVFNGCWDPETDHYPTEDPSVSIHLYGYDGYSDTMDLWVSDDDTLYLAAGSEHIEYARYSGDVTGLVIPEQRPNIDSCDGSYWEDW